MEETVTENTKLEEERLVIWGVHGHYLVEIFGIRLQCMCEFGLNLIACAYMGLYFSACAGLRLNLTTCAHLSLTSALARI